MLEEIANNLINQQPAKEYNHSCFYCKKQSEGRLLCRKCYLKNSTLIKPIIDRLDRLESKLDDIIK